MCWAEGPLDYYTMLPTTTFLELLRHFCSDYATSAATTTLRQQQGVSIEKCAGPNAQHSTTTPGYQLRHFCNNYDTSATTTILLQQRGVSIEKCAGPKAQHSTTAQGFRLRHFCNNYALLLRLRHFCNNRDDQSKNVLGRRPSTRLLHQVPKYDTSEVLQ